MATLFALVVLPILLGLVIYAQVVVIPKQEAAYYKAYGEYHENIFNKSDQIQKNMKEELLIIENFYLEEEIIIKKLIAYLTAYTKLSIEPYDFTNAKNSSAIVGDRAGLYIATRIKQPLTVMQKKRIEEFFPTNFDGYYFDLLTIFDLWYDNKDCYPPGIVVNIKRLESNGQQL